MVLTQQSAVCFMLLQCISAFREEELKISGRAEFISGGDGGIVNFNAILSNEFSY